MTTRTARKLLTGLSIAMSLPSALLGSASAQQASSNSRMVDWTPAGAAAAGRVKRSLHISKAGGTDNIVSDVLAGKSANVSAAEEWMPAGAAAADEVK